MRADAKVLLGKTDPPTNPAVNMGVWTTAILGLASIPTIFFPNLISPNIQNAIYVGLAFALPIITALLIRGKVWSPASVKQVIEEATEEAIEVNRQLPKSAVPPKAPKLL